MTTVFDLPVETFLMRSGVPSLRKASIWAISATHSCFNLGLDDDAVLVVSFKEPVVMERPPSPAQPAIDAAPISANRVKLWRENIFLIPRS